MKYQLKNGRYYVTDVDLIQQLRAFKASQAEVQHETLMFDPSYRDHVFWLIYDLSLTLAKHNDLCFAEQFSRLASNFILAQAFDDESELAKLTQELLVVGRKFSMQINAKELS